MNKILCIWVILFCTLSYTPSINAQTPLKIILKFDDVMVRNGAYGGFEILEYLTVNKIKGSFGLVGARNDETTISYYSKYLNSKDANGDRLIEIWNHGWDHSSNEFFQKSYAFQKSHFDDANAKLNRLFNIKMTTFGAPFNRNDATTNRVILESPGNNYRVTMFQSPTVSGKLNLNNRVNVEISTRVPNYDHFVTNYNNLKNSYTNFMVLQSHPDAWTSVEIAEFKKVIDFLIAEGCEFELPYEYYLSLNPSIPTPSTTQTITFPDMMIKAVGDANFTPDAVSTSGLPIVYNSSNIAVATIVSGQIQIIGNGTSIITASQIGNATFKSADYVSKTLTVDSSLSLDSVTDSSFRFANPVSDFLIIKGKEEMLSLKIFDIAGRLVLNSNLDNYINNQVKVNVRSLNKAMYIVQISTRKGTGNFKIIKN
ncbi:MULTISPECIES: T9SS type A sorting domain-containing protein [unclassified Polaribacter]|uniref:T9SS type A sorting domain-containing protein n=1 Tax=unclassified Polaribacter TaxID=196858 RepID=UPI0011BDFA5A|nr:MULTISPECIES: T9SS type A sorting domain-containing protein [unclassified Polaribacter]TXD53128.1 T9SS type A sorting domain-containing protein [Polaribacter sp. IC063]TXD61248.1 T9SS type A sorting domain-containing protein [Polaribacter sp. IC066]